LLRKMTGGFWQCVLVGTAFCAAAAVESLRLLLRSTTSLKVNWPKAKRGRSGPLQERLNPSGFASLNHLPLQGRHLVRCTFWLHRSAQKGPLEKGAGILLRKMTGGFWQCVLVGTAFCAAAAVESLRLLLRKIHLPEGELAEGQERPVWTVTREAFGAVHRKKTPPGGAGGCLVQLDVTVHYRWCKHRIIN